MKRAAILETPAGEGLAACRLRLPHTHPYDWPAMLRFLAARAIPGVERVADGAYARTIALHGAVGTVEVRAAPPHLLATIRFPDEAALPAIGARLRRLLDLDADAAAIAGALGADPLLAPLLAARPGLRVPGAWDGFELAVRAILGQQVSVAAASTLAGRLAARFGTPLAGGAEGEGLATIFPAPAALAGADIAAIGLPRARAAALAALASAAASDPALLGGDGTPTATIARLRELPGIGEWTAQYVAMRALRDADAFPTSDLGLLRAVAALTGAARPSPAELLARAEAWRPWRAYAALHLWMSDAAPAERRTA